MSVGMSYHTAGLCVFLATPQRESKVDQKKTTSLFFANLCPTKNHKKNHNICPPLTPKKTRVPNLDATKASLGCLGVGLGVRL